jgi:hypothetical protein
MNSDLENVVRQTLANARAAGQDHWTQIQEAARMIAEVRCDITESEALAMVISNCGYP